MSVVIYFDFTCRSPTGCTCGCVTPTSTRSAFQPFQHFGRILAAYGGVFVAGSLAWGVAFDGFRPDRYDLIGAGICLLGVAVIMYAPRAGSV